MSQFANPGACVQNRVRVQTNDDGRMINNE